MCCWFKERHEYIQIIIAGWKILNWENKLTSKELVPSTAHSMASVLCQTSPCDRPALVQSLNWVERAPFPCAQQTLLIITEQRIPSIAEQPCEEEDVQNTDNTCKSCHRPKRPHTLWSFCTAGKTWLQDWSPRHSRRVLGSPCKLPCCHTG
jgi:hypothetical protein